MHTRADPGARVRIRIGALSLVPLQTRASSLDRPCWLLPVFSTQRDSDVPGVNKSWAPLASNSEVRHPEEMRQREGWRGEQDEKQALRHLLFSD